MKAVTQEWVDKAESDWIALNTLFNARKSVNHDAVCFHAQQCAEKYLKGRLIEAGIAFPKTHALPALLVLALPIEPNWNVLLLPLTELTPYGVEYRYPGLTTNRAEAREARKHCETVRSAVRLALGLS